MKKIEKILLLCFLFCYSSVFSQSYENRFNTSDDDIYTNSQKNENTFATAEYENKDHLPTFGPPGDDDNTVPIDDYIPALAVVGLIIIGFMGKRKQTIKNDKVCTLPSSSPNKFINSF